MFRLAVRNSIRGRRAQHLPTVRRLHQQPPAQFQQAGFGKWLVLLAPLGAGGGVVAYAKHDDQFRRLLVESVPGIEPVLKVLLQEKGNALESATQKLNEASQAVADIGTKVSGFGSSVSDVTSSVTSKVSGFGASVSDATSSVTGFFTGSPAPESPIPAKKTNVQLTSSKAITRSEDPMLNVPAPPLPSFSAPPSASAAKSPEPSTKVITTSASASADKKSAPAAKSAEVLAATPVAPAKPSAPVQLSTAEAKLPPNIQELEIQVEIAAQKAVNSYARAIDVLKSYNQDVQKIVDDSVDKLDSNAWAQLKNKTSARDSAVLASEKAAQVARATIDNLERSLQQVAKDAPADHVERVGNHIRATSDHLNAAKDQMYNAKDAAQVSEKYWQNVEAARNYFVDEVQALFPSVNLAEKRLQLSPDEFNLFVSYAYSHVLAYQKEVQKYQAEGETRLRRAIESLRGDDSSEAVKGQLDFHLQKERQQMTLDNQKKLFAMRAEAERELRLHMKRQAEAHSDHLRDALQLKEAELKRLHERELNEKLWTEQASYKEQLAAMVGKLRGMDEALKEVDESLQARGDADRMVHQSQALWSACQALWSSVRGGEPGASWREKLRPLANEVAAVGRSGDGDELVKVVLQGVPEEAKTRGVYPEEALRERFVRVERLARRCAIVPAEDASLPTYLLSYLQSVFILTPDQVMTEAELRDEPVDVSKFDTYDILNRAKYCMERGDLVQTLKYMNLLQGQPRKIASDWMKETRILLETQQATNILMAHAATSGLSFL